ncbi:olfactory receptor 52L1-like [Eucyclogobius newberryi]|uniref:olfactory receptor 52L1-like n=1 Tax=Eucyclogobius newberryi TaxID=166745 RepID=UPI003B597D8A
MLNQSDFWFLAFPFPPWQRSLIALSLALVFAHVMLANGCLLLVLTRVEALWSPMYILVGALCVVDLLSTLVIVPNALLVLLSPDHSMSLTECLTQMFLTHFLSSLESTLLLAMALDRYAAICHPLKYRQLMDGSFFLALSLFTLLRSGSVMGVLVALAGSLDFCGSRVIQHLYCDHMALVHLGCGDTGPSQAAGVAVIVCFVGLDIPVIILSYLRILFVVHRAGEDRWKALHTCGTHLMVLLVFYLVGTVAFLSDTMNLGLASDLNTLMGLVYILLPASINPVIYGVRTSEIRQGFGRVFGPVHRVWNGALKVSSIKACPRTTPTLRHSGSN